MRHDGMHYIERMNKMHDGFAVYITIYTAAAAKRKNYRNIGKKTGVCKLRNMKKGGNKLEITIRVLKKRTMITTRETQTEQYLIS